jgi:hypothetical protein
MDVRDKLLRVVIVLGPVGCPPTKMDLGHQDLLAVVQAPKNTVTMQTCIARHVADVDYYAA